ncbi:Transcription factor FER-LIKE IRON DEFICIENCY-INDUCED TRANSCRIPTION FACTOR [Acorus gramineus]|uniref:Transcription factor FER-LIKE IRON DEFICIENCY-INDUCED TRANSCRIPTION FACTOR n=1 Tax=Acorus gramineus TaxID=55184 RepID=A0AAV9AQF8_ACOGR|nr:Transcription factor FER-LIKE IRON DEFICIENCY-INDUCED TRANSCRIPTION FACTOR [Acorus gramineus]
METEFEPYLPFQDPAAMASMQVLPSIQTFPSLDALSSWLEHFEEDDPPSNIPTFTNIAPHISSHGFEEDHDFFQFMASDNTTTHPLEDTLNSLLLDFSNGFSESPPHSLASPESFVDQFFGTSENSSPVAVNKGVEKKRKRRAEEEEQEEEEEENEDGEERNPGGLNSKNLFSERSRRKRLSKQLISLRSLVPNITKMDKRSVLVDALAYLKSIHEETACLQAELMEKTTDAPPEEKVVEEALEGRRMAVKGSGKKKSGHKAHILEIDTEKIEDRRFVVKMTCRGGSGVGGEVLRAVESLGFDITYTSLDQIKPQHVLITIFVRIRKPGRMTEEKLKDCITSTAIRSGLTLHNP